ncbi:hypothetical protein L1987_04989 [Smallanthus sonchifolius]|uniref:Uncharacterized protein n=1 Tax=Smallanthus sonchifolius TaxID=185202 RepID=A0ACB9JUA7_9ASTR|nr:hypothetical protein L1987_04989 [Smallanthus sonchifolius]
MTTMKSMRKLLRFLRPIGWKKTKSPWLMVHRLVSTLVGPMFKFHPVDSILTAKGGLAQRYVGWGQSSSQVGSGVVGQGPSASKSGVVGSRSYKWRSRYNKRTGSEFGVEWGWWGRLFGFLYYLESLNVLGQCSRWI